MADLIATAQEIEYFTRMEALKVHFKKSKTPTRALGVCYDCKKAIPLKRRNAYPSATRCIGCQTRHEQSEGRR